jgi:hypothetical protein
MRPPDNGRARLLAAATIAATPRPRGRGLRTHPGWTSASAFRRMREARVGMQGLKHGYIAAALNYRVSW